MPNTLLPSITDRLDQLTFAQKVWLAVAGIIFLSTAFIFLVLLPLWKESKTLQEDIDREKLKLAQILRTRTQIDRFKRELVEMDLRYKQIQAMLPETKEIPLLLKTVSNLGQEQGLEFLLFKPEKENPKEFVAEIPITLNFRGSYHQIGVFFDHIRRLPRIINIEHLEMGAFEEKTGRLNVRCQLVTFRVLPFPSAPSTMTPTVEKKK